MVEYYSVDENGLKANLCAAVERIERASAKTGSRVTLVAATKTVPADVIDSVIGMGVSRVGENRVQEYLAKRDFVSCAEWHFIGTLQRNKAKYLVGNVALIQSVSSVELAREIDRLAALRGVVQDVLVEVNIGSEIDKTGAPVDTLDCLVDSVRSLDGLRLRGLMAVPPKGAYRSVYERLYKMYSDYSGGAFDTLSVGMSGDYELAISCGSNMVRLGTAIFGKRS